MQSTIEFRVLGSWEVTRDGAAVAVPAGHLRVLLASLLLTPGAEVPGDVLVERLWPHKLPATGRGALHTQTTRLRQLLGHDVLPPNPGSGYRLAVEPEQVDLWRFRDLVRRAGRADSPADELALLQRARRLWRGRPFTGVEAAWLELEVVPLLTEEWFTATERRLDLQSDTPEPAGHIAELRELSAAFPTRESLWTRLVAALHRAGRRAEAVEAFHRIREVLGAELGIGPGAELQRLYREVLRDGAPTDRRRPPPRPPAASTPAAPVRQLPPDLATFCPRTELAELDRLLSAIRVDSPQLTRIVAIDGAPGAGKSTLAVHWAHRLAASSHPDLQLYLDLKGHGPGEPVGPAAGAAMLLRSLGVPGAAIPAELDERATLLRSILAGRRALLLLDDARDAGQVRPLLPGGASLVVVTSRPQLRGLAIRDGAHRVTLGSLTRPEALAVLAAALGPDALHADAAAADRLVELCAGLPLALAIAAERARRSAGLRDVVHALDDEEHRLDALSAGDGDPRADLRVAVSWSYRALPPAAAALFRVLGLHPAGEIGVPAAAALAGVPVATAQRWLDHLVAAHLVLQPHPDRYQLHDLIRSYARERAGAEDSAADRDRAVARLLDLAAETTDQQHLNGRGRSPSRAA